jgi:hypothetical protein
MWSDNKLLLQIANLGGGDSGSGMTFRGEYDNLGHNPDPLAPFYFVGDVVTVSLGNGVFIPGIFPTPQNARPGTYICIRNNEPLTDSTLDAPVWPQYPHPTIDKRYWELIGGLQHFRGNYQADPSVSNDTLPDIIDRGFGAPAYMQGDIVQVAPTSDFASAATVPGTYICVVDDPSPAEFPVHTLTPRFTPDFDYPGRSSWVLLSTWPSARNDCDASGSLVQVYGDQQIPTDPPP